MPPTFNYRSEWKRMRGPWGINWNTMVSKENGDTVTSPAPMPVASPALVQPAPVSYTQPRQAPDMDPYAAMAQYSGIMDSQIAELQALDAGDGGRAYNQGMIEVSKSIAEAARAKAMAKYLEGLAPIDFSASVDYPMRPVRPAVTPFVAPEVPINPWAAGFAALAGLVDPNAAAPVAHNLLDATVNRQEVIRQQAQQAWQQALADQNQRYEDSLAGYGQDVARATSARDLALKMALAKRQDDIARYQLKVEGDNPLIDATTQAAIDTAGKAAVRREAILAGLKATQVRYDTEAKRAALQTTEAGKTERVGIQTRSAQAIAEGRAEAEADRAILNNKAETARLVMRLDAQQRITNAGVKSRERVANIAAHASMYGSDARSSLSGGGMSDQQKAQAAALESAYQQSASNYRTVVGNADITWSGTVKAQAAAALRDMLAKEKVYTDYVTGLQSPGLSPGAPGLGTVRVTFPTPGTARGGATVTRTRTNGGGGGKAKVKAPTSATPMRDALVSALGAYARRK